MGTPFVFGFWHQCCRMQRSCLGHTEGIAELVELVDLVLVLVGKNVVVQPSLVGLISTDRDLVPQIQRQVQPALQVLDGRHCLPVSLEPPHGQVPNHDLSLPTIPHRCGPRHSGRVAHPPLRLLQVCVIINFFWGACHCTLDTRIMLVGEDGLRS